MKYRKILSLVLAGVLALSLTACGAGKPKVDYDTEFDALMERVEELGEKADFVSTVNIVIWQEAGPEEVAAVLATLLTVENANDLKPHAYDIKEAFDTSSELECVQYAKRYQEEYKTLSSELDTLKTDIKALKDACGDDHDDGIDALQKYFSKLQAYAEFATNPSGNLMNYRSNHESFENDMSELKSAAEFDK